MTKHTLRLDDEQLSTVIEALRTELKRERNGGTDAETCDYIEDVLHNVCGQTEPAPSATGLKCRLCGAETACDLCGEVVDGGLGMDIELKPATV